jgi:hypothetical protein
MTLATFVRRFLPGAPPETTDRPLFPPASPEVLEYGKSPACLAAVEAVNAIVFDTLPKEPKVNPALLEQRSIMREAGLAWQAHYLDHQIRLDACKALGLAIYDDQGGANLLAGRPTKATRLKGWRAFDRSLDLKRHSLESMNDLLGRNEENRPEIGSLVGAQMRDENEIVRDAFRAFDVKGQERLVYGLLADLRYPISLGVVLRMQIAKTFQCLGESLFHGFAVVAPESCWAVPEKKKDPLLFGVILGPINRKTRCFEDRFALLARWE